MFGEQVFQTTDPKEVALKIAALPKKNADRKRLVVFTRGKDPTIIVHGVLTYNCILLM